MPLDLPDVRGLEQHPLVEAVLNGEGGRSADVVNDLIINRASYEYIVDGKEPESSGRRNLGTIRCVEAVQRSTELGRPITIAGPTK